MCVLPVVGLLAGCAGASSSAGQLPEMHPVAVTSEADVRAPVLAYDLSEADQRAMFAAVGELQSRCAERFGSRFVNDLAVDQRRLEDDYVRTFGVVDLDRAKRLGYGREIDPAAAQREEKPAVAAPGEALWSEIMSGQTEDGEPSRITAADGSPLPAEGCGTWAWRQLWGGEEPPQMLDLITQTLSDSYSRTLVDPRAVAVEAEWSGCMQGKGYTAQHRWDAGNAVAGKPEQEQIATAVADTECAIATNYVGVWSAVDAAYQERAMAEQEGLFQQAAAEQREIIERANRVLQGGNP